MTARGRLRDTVSIQVVAFPQSGVVTRPGTAELLEQAVKDGAELIGGVDPTGIDRDAAGQLDVVFGIAGRYGAGVDIHLHDGGEEGATQIRMIAERTRALGLAGKVAVSHAFCLGMVEEPELEGLLALLREQRIAIMTTAPGDRPTPPVRRLREAGVTVGAGSDGVRDAWTPLGRVCWSARCWSHTATLRSPAATRSTSPPRQRGRAGLAYGLEVGFLPRRSVVVPGETSARSSPCAPARARDQRGRVVGDGQCAA
jgi:hypothetical protein